MRETIITLFLLLLISIVCWFLVFNKSARYKVQRGAWRLYGLESQEQREVYDALYSAGLLVGALVFTIIFFASLVAAIAGRS